MQAVKEGSQPPPSLKDLIDGLRSKSVSVMIEVYAAVKMSAESGSALSADFDVGMMGLHTARENLEKSSFNLHVWARDL